jgi:hypothetical protein
MVSIAIRVTDAALLQKSTHITKWVWQVLVYSHKVKFCFQKNNGSSNVTADTHILVETQGANLGENTLASKERSIYPNLKLRVYTTGMRQNRLAKLVGIDEAYLSRIINGVRVPGKQMQLQIAEVLGCDADWLFQQAKVQAGMNFGREISKVG